jgi:hypothetical protein
MKFILTLAALALDQGTARMASIRSGAIDAPITIASSLPFLFGWRCHITCPSSVLLQNGRFLNKPRLLTRATDAVELAALILSHLQEIASMNRVRRRLDVQRIVLSILTLPHHLIPDLLHCHGIERGLADIYRDGLVVSDRRRATGEEYDR